MNKRSEIVWLVLFLTSVFTGATAKAQDLPFKLNAHSAIVVDADTGKVIFDKHSDQIRPIASITKLMTAIVTLDANLPMDEEIGISREEVEATKTNKGSRNISRSLPLGIVLTRAELLHLALMNSQNRAAAALARTYPGGTEAFVAAMNKKAQELKMDDTKYVDPTGLYNENVSSAHDLAILVRYASTYELINDFSTTPSFELTTYTQKRRAKKLAFKTTNRLVRQTDWNLVLQKTGYIRDSGHCLVLMAEMGVKKVIIVLLNTVSNTARAADASNIKYYIETGEVPKVKIVERKKTRHTVKKKSVKVVQLAPAQPTATPVAPAQPVAKPKETMYENFFHKLLRPFGN